MIQNGRTTLQFRLVTILNDFSKSEPANFGRFHSHIPNRVPCVLFYAHLEKPTQTVPG